MSSVKKKFSQVIALPPPPPPALPTPARMPCSCLRLCRYRGMPCSCLRLCGLASAAAAGEGGGSVYNRNPFSKTVHNCKCLCYRCIQRSVHICNQWRSFNPRKVLRGLNWQRTSPLQHPTPVSAVSLASLPRSMPRAPTHPRGRGDAPPVAPPSLASAYASA